VQFEKVAVWIGYNCLARPFSRSPQYSHRYSHSITMIWRGRVTFTKSSRRPPPETRRYSPTHVRVIKQPNRSLRSLEQAGKSWGVASKTTKNRSYNRV